MEVTVKKSIIVKHVLKRPETEHTDFDEEDYTCVDIDSTDHIYHDKWVLPRLYKVSEDRVISWRIGWNKSMTSLVTIHGSKNKVTSYRIILSNSARTASEKAFNEACTRFTNCIYKKLYYRFNEGCVGGKLVMRGIPYTDKCIDRYPVYCQPKLDGLRCVANLDSHSSSSRNTSVVLRSKSNKLWLNKDNIRKDVCMLLSILPSGSEIDGELYIHDAGFNTIQSICTTHKTVHKDEDKLEYHIFDIMIPSMTFKDRWKVLSKAYAKYRESFTGKSTCILVETKMCSSIKSLNKFTDRMLSNNYEGSIIRFHCTGEEEQDSNNKYYKRTLYLNTKCNNVVKHKVVHDEEGVILGISETQAGNKSFDVRDPRGNVFKLRYIGTREEQAKIYDECNIGKYVTYQYRALTEDKKVPKHSYGIRIREVD